MGKRKIAPPVITFDRQAAATKSSKFIDYHKFFQKLLKKVCWHQQFS